MNEYLVEKYGPRLRSHSVEVQVDSATNTTYRLPDDSILRDKPVVGVFTVRNPNDNAKSAIGRDIVSDEILDSSYLTIFDGNVRKIDFLPLSTFAIGENDTQVKPFDIECFTPSKSEINISTGATITAGESFLLNFLYLA